MLRYLLAFAQRASLPNAQVNEVLRRVTINPGWKRDEGHPFPRQILPMV